MFRKSAAIFLIALTVAGCATTTRTSQTDLDAVNAKVAQLQAELADRDAELARIQNKMHEDEVLRVQAESERRALAERLDSTLAELKSAQARPKPSRSSESDLK